MAAARCYIVTVERLVVYRTETFFAAVAYLFACYFVFNVEYPKKLVATLEFMQR